MGKKRRFKISMIFQIVIPGLLGFFLFFWAMSSVNQETAIEEELSRISVYEFDGLQTEVKDSSVQVEKDAIEYYLKEYQAQIQLLTECKETLEQNAQHQTEIEEPEWVVLDEQNERAYETLVDMTENPGKHIEKALNKFGEADEYNTEFCLEALEIVNVEKELESDLKDIYLYNKAALEQIKAKFIL